MDNLMHNFQSLIKKMDLPDWRKIHLTPQNLRWLARNMGVRNSEDPNFPLAQQILVQLLKNMNHDL